MDRKFNSQNIPIPRNTKPLPQGYNFLDIEIGCGVGFHPIFYAKSHPERLLVAIEKTSEKYAKFNRRYKNHGEPENLVPIHANAIAWIAHFLKQDSVDRYFILYPNPYPKDPQKRFFAMPFMEYLVHTLRPGGMVTLATNEEFYYKEAACNGPSTWGLRIEEDRVLDLNEKPRTHFEKKYLLRKEKCFNLVFRKN